MPATDRTSRKNVVTPWAAVSTIRRVSAAEHTPQALDGQAVTEYPQITPA
ncbi:MAG: hypothetical protein JNK06_05560 [Candidatus Accumulibacter phosphatis]|nr:hypothetical protein [Candidatus Accumulibacter phosphatis]